MELLKEIFVHALLCGEIKIDISCADGTLADVIEGKCYQALKKIKSVLEDDSLTDKECFLKIEEIVCIYEELGSNGGTRHDFG